MNTIRHYLIAICTIATLSLQAQETENNGPLSLENQIDEIIEGSGNYNANGKSYEVVERSKLTSLRGNVKERIDRLQEEIGSLKGEIATQKTKIGELTKSLGDTEATLTAINEEKDSMNFFGTLMSKGSYSTMMWSIVGVLLLGLLFFIYKFKNSNAVTKESRYKLDEVEADFDEYRKMALEKEQKLGRQLQDERNKLLKAQKG
ncbi:hypothetical protein EAX61_06195 [Dokdonia sinensis]|uniref:tRNA (Guanine-N1)-methyltransferase n=1 Tax=Dokdonia sinensis TaxID=2479847 RepID=A0A3M0G7X9_9FLAO|nr:hypothetical protein [Dokdonia sinensis]RMB61065.1 hypothetical protein EAX61_06195 [Dokdonia sinensis]